MYVYSLSTMKSDCVFDVASMLYIYFVKSLFLCVRHGGADVSRDVLLARDSHTLYMLVSSADIEIHAVVSVLLYTTYIPNSRKCGSFVYE